MEAATKTVMTSLPGKIVSYDPATKLAVVEPMVHNGNPIPPIPAVPVKWPRFGGYRLVGPLDVGDEVTLHFYKWDASRFRKSGELSAANMVRDGGIYPIAVPGSEASTDYDGGGDANLHLGSDDGDTEIVVSPTQIKLGSTSAASGVSKGDVTDSNFTALRAWIATHVHSGGTISGSTGTPAAPPPTPTATASTKVFTE